MVWGQMVWDIGTLVNVLSRVQNSFAKTLGLEATQEVWHFATVSNKKTRTLTYSESNISFTDRSQADVGTFALFRDMKGSPSAAAHQRTSWILNIHARCKTVQFLQVKQAAYHSWK